MEKRAVQVSHELWRQIMTQGHTNLGFRCVEGIPENATLCALFERGGWPRPDPVFIFESDNWDGPPSEWKVRVEGQEFPVHDVVFQITECRTCRWWEREGIADGYCECPHIDIHMTDADFGCTQYEKQND